MKDKNPTFLYNGPESNLMNKLWELLVVRGNMTTWPLEHNYDVELAKCCSILEKNQGIMGKEHFLCVVCHEVLPKGRGKICSPACLTKSHREYQAVWYLNNKEKAREAHKKWQEAHPEYRKTHYLKNREKIASRSKEHYYKNKEKNKDRMNKYAREYYRKNKEKIAEKVKERNRKRREEVTNASIPKTQTN